MESYEQKESLAIRLFLYINNVNLKNNKVKNLNFLGARKATKSLFQAASRSWQAMKLQ